MRLKIYKTFYIWATLLSTLSPTLASVQPDPTETESTLSDKETAGPASAKKVPLEQKFQPLLCKKSCDDSDVLLSNYFTRQNLQGSDKRALCHLTASNMVLANKLLAQQERMITNYPTLLTKPERQWLTKRKENLQNCYRNSKSALQKYNADYKNHLKKKKAIGEESNTQNLQFSSFTEANRYAWNPSVAEGINTIVPEPIAPSEGGILPDDFDNAPSGFKPYLLRNAENMLFLLQKNLEAFENEQERLRLGKAIAAQVEIIAYMKSKTPQLSSEPLADTVPSAYPPAILQIGRESVGQTSAQGTAKDTAPAPMEEEDSTPELKKKSRPERFHAVLFTKKVEDDDILPSNLFQRHSQATPPVAICALLASNILLAQKLIDQHDQWLAKHQADLASHDWKWLIQRRSRLSGTLRENRAAFDRWINNPHMREYERHQFNSFTESKLMAWSPDLYKELQTTPYDTSVFIEKGTLPGDFDNAPALFKPYLLKDAQNMLYLLTENHKAFVAAQNTQEQLRLEQAITAQTQIIASMQDKIEKLSLLSMTSAATSQVEEPHVPSSDIMPAADPNATATDRTFYKRQSLPREAKSNPRTKVTNETQETRKRKKSTTAQRRNKTQKVMTIVTPNTPLLSDSQAAGVLLSWGAQTPLQTEHTLTSIEDSAPSGASSAAERERIAALNRQEVNNLLNAWLNRQRQPSAAPTTVPQENPLPPDPLGLQLALAEGSGNQVTQETAPTEEEQAALRKAWDDVYEQLPSEAPTTAPQENSLPTDPLGLQLALGGGSGNGVTQETAPTEEEQAALRKAWDDIYLHLQGE